MPDQRTFVGEVDPVGGGRLWYDDGTGVRRPLERVGDSGLSWGYAGNGPRAAALSLLAATTGDAAAAEPLKDAFLRDVVAILPLNERFALPVATVESWLAANGVGPTPSRRRRRADTAPEAGAQAEPEADHLGTDLAARARAIDERERDLVARELRVDAMAAAVGVVAAKAPADSLPAEPLRRQLEALVIDSGDDIDVVARAHGLDAAWATAVATGAVSQLDLADVRLACEALRCTPYDLWGVAGARSVAHGYGPADWPPGAEALLPVDGADAPVLAPGRDWPALAANPSAPPAAASAPELAP